jgi:transposase
MVFDREAEHGAQWEAICSVASKIGCSPQGLRRWVRQAERDRGDRPGRTMSERERLKQLERENCELKRANEVLRKASNEVLRQALAFSPWRSQTGARDDGGARRQALCPALWGEPIYPELSAAHIDQQEGKSRQRTTSSTSEAAVRKRNQSSPHTDSATSTSNASLRRSMSSVI